MQYAIADSVWDLSRFLPSWPRFRFRISITRVRHSFRLWLPHTYTHGGSIVLIVRGRIFNSACFRRVRASGKGAHVRRRKIKMRKSISMHRERVTSGGRRSRKAARITIFSNAAATTLLQPPPQPSRAQRTNKNRTNIWFDSEWQHYTWLISRFTFAT